MAQNKVRLEDVARTAGVSLSSVWRVMNRTGRVSPEIAEAVRKAAEKLQVNLRQRTGTKLIAFLLGNRHLLHPFHSRILAGVESYCTQRDYHTVYLSLQYSQHAGWEEISVPKILRELNLVDGFILAGVHAQNLLDLLVHNTLPFVVQGNSFVGVWRDQQCDSVWYDDVGGGYRMTSHLQSQGHRDIWFVGNRRFPWFDHFYEGYSRAMTERGLMPHSFGLDLEQPSEVGYLAVKSILSQGGPVSAIVAGSDATAQGVYAALRECGLRVPENISVTGFDDIEADALHPRLTTSHVFLEQIGKQMAEFLLSRIEQPNLPPRKSVIPTKLVKSESTAPILSLQSETKNCPSTLESGICLTGELEVMGEK